MNFLKPRRRLERIRAAAADAALATDKASLKLDTKVLTKGTNLHEERTLQDEGDERAAEAWNSKE